MAQNFSKYAGIIQVLMGALGKFGPESLTTMLGAASGNNIISMLLGLVLSYFGFKGTDGQQRMGAQVGGGLSALVGLLGTASIAIPGLDLSQGVSGANIVNLLVGAWGLYSGFAKKTAGAAAH